MTDADASPVTKAGRRDWRPLVSLGLFTCVRWLLIAAGVYWYYANRHSGDLVARLEAVVLVLAGIWARCLLQVRSATHEAGAP